VIKQDVPVAGVVATTRLPAIGVVGPLRTGSKNVNGIAIPRREIRNALIIPAVGSWIFVYAKLQDHIDPGYSNTWVDLSKGDTNDVELASKSHWIELGF